MCVAAAAPAPAPALLRFHFPFRLLFLLFPALFPLFCRYFLA